MSPVELIPVQGSLVLRARGSELLILSHYIIELKKLTVPKEFAEFFMHQALINRPARKLFEAWLRKDKTLWKRIYNAVMNEIEIDEETMKAAESRQEESVEPTPAADSTEEAEAEAEAEEGEDQVPAKKKATKKKAAKKAETKPAKKKAAKKKAAKKAESKPAKKKAAKKAETKPAKKKAAKKKAATKTAKKKAAKKKTAKKK